MEQSTSWEITNPLASEAIRHRLWKPKVHYSIHNSSPLAQHIP